MFVSIFCFMEEMIDDFDIDTLKEIEFERKGVYTVWEVLLFGENHLHSCT